MGAGLSPGCFISDPDLFLWAGRAEKDGSSSWDPAPAWETWRNLLAPTLDRLSSGHWSHLGSKPADEISLYISFSL